MTPKQERALAALISCPTARAAAKAAGLSESALRRYKQDPVFQAEYSKRCNELLEAACTKAKSVLPPAIVQDDTQQPREHSHAGGLDYVPYNDYVANLHRGEMVLTAREADEYRKNGVQGGTGFVVNQTIYAAKQTPVELAAATRAAFQRARWATV